jgi:hypothetical protein
MGRVSSVITGAALIPADGHRRIPGAERSDPVVPHYINPLPLVEALASRTGATQAGA